MTSARQIDKYVLFASAAVVVLVIAVGFTLYLTGNPAAGLIVTVAGTVIAGANVVWAVRRYHRSVRRYEQSRARRQETMPWLP